MRDRNQLPRTEIHHRRRTSPARDHPAGIAQEAYALLITYQALRTALSDLMPPWPDPTSAPTD
jgi:hypothetical protein